MAALQMALSAARRSGQPDKLDDALGDAIGRLQQEIETLRSLITDLRPAALDEFGTLGAVEALVERVARNGLAVDLSADLAYEQGRRPTRHTAELEAAVYRTVQEALTNAVKHGHAKRAVVEILEDETTVHVTVRDDGAGFDPAERTDGFGLLGMRERVQLLDGTLEIESAPGEGTTVSATFPVQRRGEGPQAEVRDIRSASG